MAHPIRAFALVLLLLAPGARWGLSAEPSLAPRDGILVLRNGQILRGAITQLGDRYVVSLSGHDELRIPVDEVEMHCRDVKEAYRQKQVLLLPGSVRGHLDLAEWCLRHRMLAEAADQLLAASAIDPEHPRLRPLERRLSLAAREPTSSTAAIQAAQAAVAERQDLEQAMRQLPPGTLEEFTLGVQPLLLNYCGSSGCHGTTSQSQFRLLRPSRGQPITRRITQRNLHAALSRIDKQDPEQSALLVVPQRPHGMADQPIFDQRSIQQFEILAAWVKQVVRQGDGSQPETISRPDAVLLQASKSSGSFSDPTEQQRAETVDPDAERQQGAVARLPEAEPSGDDGKGEPRGAFVPRDPFDPEIFNRRYFSRP